jgi:hypothetical protein
MEDENVIIQKFLNCDDIIIEILLNQIIQFQYTKMIDDLNKVLSSLKRDRDYSHETAQMATMAIVAIYNAEMSYINVIWDNKNSGVILTRILDLQVILKHDFQIV